MKNPLLNYNFASRYTKDKFVVEAPCRIGYGSSILQAKEYVGYDKSENVINYAKEHFNSNEVSYLVSTVEDYLDSWYPSNRIRGVFESKDFKFKAPIYYADTTISFELLDKLKKPKLFIRNCILATNHTVILSVDLNKYSALNFINTCTSSIIKVNKLYGNTALAINTKCPDIKISYFWEYNDEYPCIVNLDLNNLPSSGIILAVIEKS